METVAYKLLADATPVAAIVAKRIHHDLKPQDEREPSIVIQTPDVDWMHTHEGSAGWGRGLIRVNCFADTKQKSKDLATAARAALDNIRDQAINGVIVGRLEVKREAGIPRTPQKGKQRPVFGRLLDCDFVIKETTP